MPNRLLRVAHRGASREAPENTLRALKRALELGVDAIEVDARLTRDGAPVLFHDANLRRLARASGRVEDLTRAELQAYRVGGEPIPTLGEALQLVRGRAILHIEVKPGEQLGPILKSVRDAEAEHWVVLGSFDAGLVGQMTSLAPEIPRLLISEGPGRKVRGSLPAALRLAGQIAATGAGGVSLDRRAVRDEAFVRALHARGFSLWCWTVNGTREMRRLAAWGVDAILSDDPARLATALETE